MGKPRKPHPTSLNQRDVLLFKLTKLEDYVSKREQQLEQFISQLNLSEITLTTQGIHSFLDHIINNLTKLYSSNISISIIKQEIENSKQEIDQIINQSTELSEIQQQLLDHGFNENNMPDGVLAAPTLDVTNVFKTLIDMRSNIRSGDDPRGMADDLISQMRSLHSAIDATLEPARHLRRQWLDHLNGEAPKNSTLKTRARGRPKDAAVETRNKKIAEAWSTKEYQTYKEIALNFNVSEDTVKKALTQHRNRSKNKSSNSEIEE